MNEEDLVLATEPFIAAEADNWLVVYKPSGMHSSGNGRDLVNNLPIWLSSNCPEFSRVRGYADNDHGILHRLDKDTAGLLLVAKSQDFFDAFMKAENSKITKYYYFYVEPIAAGLQGGLPVLNYPEDCGAEAWNCYLTNRDHEAIIRHLPRSISSLFRAFGEGRAQVACGRPGLTASSKKQWTGESYTTTVDALDVLGTRLYIHVHLNRGFRHQIRTHLAWYGLPLGGDRLYNPRCRDNPEAKMLSLTACALDFVDLDGTPRYVRLPKSSG